MAYFSSLGFYSEDFRTVLEGSGILDQFRLLFSWSGVLSCGFPRSCAWTSGLAKSHDIVSHGHVLRSWFVKGDERSSLQIVGCLVVRQQWAERYSLPLEQSVVR